MVSNDLYFTFFQVKHSDIKLDTPSEASSPFTSSLQPSAKNFVVAKKWKDTDRDQKDLTLLVTDMIANDLLPLSFVESTSFRAVMKRAQPAFSLPSRKHLSNTLIPQRADSVQTSVRTLLKDAKDLALALDLWSSRDMRSFIGITCHFILDFSMRSAMLGCHRFTGSHTAENIHHAFSETVSSYDINSKISTIVTDNASNMVSAFSMPGFDTSEDTNDNDTEDNTAVPATITDELDFLPPKQSPKVYPATLTLSSWLLKMDWIIWGSLRQPLLKPAKSSPLCKNPPLHQNN